MFKVRKQFAAHFPPTPQFLLGMITEPNIYLAKILFSEEPLNWLIKLVLDLPGSAVEEETLGSGKPVCLFVTGEAAVGQFSVQVIILLEKR